MWSDLAQQFFLESLGHGESVDVLDLKSAKKQKSSDTQTHTQTLGNYNNVDMRFVLVPGLFVVNLRD